MTTIPERLEALRPKLTIINAYGWIIARDRTAFLRDTLFDDSADDLDYALQDAICEVFCDLLDADHPWTTRDAMIGAILRRTYQGDPNKHPASADIANATSALADVIHIGGFDDTFLAITTHEGVRAYCSSEYRRNLLREMKAR